MKTVICADSFEWLPANRDVGSIVTSLPDASEIKIEKLDEYEKWVRRAATEIFASASEGCPVIFIQTDRRKGGRQFSKASLLMNIATEQGWFLLWHKIELAAEVGKSNLYRPTFRNMICFGKGKMSAGQATPDVIPPSKRLYEMAFGFAAARVCVEFCKKFSNRICDPFCGYGTVLHVAEQEGMNSVGVDVDGKCCEASQNWKEPEMPRCDWCFGAGCAECADKC
jgi:DNA modification methylase